MIKAVDKLIFYDFEGGINYPIVVPKKARWKNSEKLRRKKCYTICYKYIILYIYIQVSRQRNYDGITFFREKICRLSAT